jgi:hypothetical protein
MILNFNTGRWHVKGGTQPPPVQASSEILTDGRIKLDGNIATFTFRANTIDELSDVANMMLFGLPIFLNARLQFPCVVESIVGQAAEGRFGYEVGIFDFTIPLVSKEDQERRASAALRFFSMLCEDHRRIYAGLAYFYRACRLVEAGHAKWEFMAEAVLNLAKTLEALFPPQGDAKTRDAVRDGLKALGFGTEEIELWFTTALALRSELDVAHVGLALLSGEHIEALTLYTDSALDHFRSLFERLFEALLTDRSPVPIYVSRESDSGGLKILTTLASRLKDKLPLAKGRFH